MVGDEKSKLKALSDIASIDITLEFDTILQNILKITCETMNAHSGTMMLIEENNELRMVASYGLASDYPERVHEAAKKAGVPLTFSPAGAVLETGKCYIVPNVFEEPRCTPWDNLSKEFGFSSQIFTPMKRGLKVIGLLNVYMAAPHQFTEEEINFVTIAASQASSVVQNARMCSRLKENLQELKDYKEHLEEKIKETHKKLYDSERYLRAIIESSLDGIVVIDEEGRFEFANKSFCNIMSWPRKEIFGQRFIKVLPYDVKEFCLDMWKEVQNGKNCFETKIVTKNGETKHLHVSVVQAIVKRKKKVVSIIKDVSENKILELSLKESEAKYRDIFENANDCLYIHDAEGNFKQVNNTALKLLGCKKEEIIGTHMSEWITPESLKLAQNCLEKGLAGGPAEQQMVLEVICRNGENKWMEIRRRLVKEGDRITAIHGIGRDITEKRRLEQQLKEYNEQLEKSYEELKEADRLKSEFVSNITHELFTPITSIKGFTELIHSGDLGGINEEQKNGLETILRSSDRLSRLLKQLLDVANIEKDQLELRFEFTSINDVILKSIMELQPHVKEKQITIFQEIPTLPRIWGDSERLTQVMINVLSNAIKFTPENGKITITADENTDSIKISITDTGIGIPQDKLLRIFDRFYQVDGSTSRKQGGVGIGLSICKGIIEKHRGSIWAESDGSGSTFHIVLPKLMQKAGELDDQPRS